MYEWYNTSHEDREKAGLEGREYCLLPETMLSANNMGDAVIKSAEECWDNWELLNNFKYTRFKMSKLVTVIGPVGTRSGYGSHSRDIVLSLLDLGYDVKTLPIRWGQHSLRMHWTIITKEIKE